MVKRSCCNGVSFTPESIVYAEDELFNIKLLNSTIKKVVYLSKAFYHYVKHTLSLTAFSDVKVILSRIKEVEEIEKILDPQKYDDFFSINNLETYLGEKSLEEIVNTIQLLRRMILLFFL